MRSIATHRQSCSQDYIYSRFGVEIKAIFIKFCFLDLTLDIDLSDPPMFCVFQKNIAVLGPT